MLFHDNPKEKLVWLEDELLDDELEEILYGGEDEDPEDDWDTDSDEETDEDEEEEYEAPRKSGKRKSAVLSAWMRTTRNGICSCRRKRA